MLGGALFKAKSTLVMLTLVMPQFMLGGALSRDNLTLVMLTSAALDLLGVRLAGHLLVLLSTPTLSSGTVIITKLHRLIGRAAEWF